MQKLQWGTTSHGSEWPSSKKSKHVACLVAHWWRICLPTQATQALSLVQEDPTCHRATKAVRYSYWTCALELGNHNYQAHVLQLLKPACPRARATQQDKPLQWEAYAQQLERRPPLDTTREKPTQQWGPGTAKSQQTNLYKIKHMLERVWRKGNPFMLLVAM